MTEPGAIWVQSDVSPDGAYVVGLHAGDDRAWVLSRDEAVAHAAAVVTQAERAEHDAAVIKLLHTTLGLPMEQAVQVIGSDIRPDRPPVEEPGPLRLVPGVSQRGGVHGFLTLQLDGTPVGQWDIGDAHHHALGVLQAVAAVDNDAGLYRLLVGRIGLDEQRARAVVADIAHHRISSA